MEEPSVLDLLKDKLAFWRPSTLHLQWEEEAEDGDVLVGMNGNQGLSTGVETFSIPVSETQAAPEPLKETVALKIPWRTLGALSFALIAQKALEPPSRSVPVGVGLYGFALLVLLWAYFSGEWTIAPNRSDERFFNPAWVRLEYVGAAVILAAAAFILFGPIELLGRSYPGGKFTFVNLVLWGLSLFFFMKAFWVSRPGPGVRIFDRLKAIGIVSLNLRTSGFAFLAAGVILLVVFFRVTQLDAVPPEMVSDHAEKLLDVQDVLDGQWNIFFPRNTGREAFQFYLTAAVVQLFGTGVTFLSLKIGTVLAGLFTLPYMYLLGKEIGNRWVGILAVLMAGIAYWPNVFSRLGLRFPLYPLFVAPAFYYLIRGLRTSNRNDFLLAGLALGIGLHGYTSFRIVPFVVLIAVGLYLIHRQSKGARGEAITGLILLTLVSLLVFLPLLRYALENPDMFVYRAFSRLGESERSLPGPAWQIFLQNLWNAMTMFFWSDGEIWVHSVTFRPALDFVSGALFFIGTALLFVRYLHRRHWLDLFLLVSVPLLMMPSILSLAFPGENPSLNRTAGAIVPVFLIIALAMEGLFQSMKRHLPARLGTAAAWALALVLVGWSCLQNYELVFGEYRRVYLVSSWNTSEIGQVIRGFTSSVGTPDSAWVVGYPYWVDTRLVGINAGYPRRDFAIWPDQIPATQAVPHPKLFILNPQDTAGVTALEGTYPRGTLMPYQSAVPTKDFLMYLVLPGDQPESYSLGPLAPTP